MLTLSCENKVSMESENENQLQWEKIPIKYAREFQLYETDRYVKINVGKEGETSVGNYQFLKEANGSDTLSLPIRNLTTISTTHLAFIDALNGLEYLSSIPHSDRVLAENIRKVISKKALHNIGQGNRLNFEVLADTKPDVIFTYPFDAPSFNKIESLGILPLHIAEYMEDNPLGRAEWVKLFGVLLGEEELAERIFLQIEANYLQVQATLNQSEKSPTILFGSSWKGQWHAPSGKSFFAQFIQDAGGDYVFSSYQKRDNVLLDLEEVIKIGEDADQWGQILFSENEVTKQEFTRGDSRYETLRPTKENQLFYCNTSDADYFGKGILEPDVVVKDLAAIFHPNLFPNHTFTYFKPLEVD